MEKMLSSKKTIALFVLPGFLLFLAMFIFPIGYTFFLSMTSWEGIGPKEFVGLQNYIQLLTQDNIFHLGIRNTLIILAVSLVGQLIPAFVLALLLYSATKGTRIFRNAFFIPVLMSSAAIALMWQKIYDPNYGMLNDLLTRMGMADLIREWMTDPATSLIAVLVPVIWQWIGYHMIIMYAGLKGLSEQYIEAAKIDGANFVQIALHIIAPMMRDIIKVCVVLATVGALKIFDNIYIMTGGGPYNLTTTIAIQMYKESFLKLQFGYGGAIAVLLGLICMITFLVINRVMTRESVEY